MSVFMIGQLKGRSLLVARNQKTRLVLEFISRLFIHYKMVPIEFKRAAARQLGTEMNRMNMTGTVWLSGILEIVGQQYFFRKELCYGEELITPQNMP